MCKRYDKLVTTPITNSASVSDMAWLVEQAVTSETGTSYIVTWDIYNYALAGPAEQLTTVAACVGRYSTLVEYYAIKVEPSSDNQLLPWVKGTSQ